MTLGEKMKYIRKKRGLTQQDLAGDFISRNMISQIERGAATPSVQALAHFSNVLKVDPSVFFDQSSSMDDFEMQENFKEIKSYYRDKKYSMCIRLSSEMMPNEISNDELLLILYDCYYHEAVARFETSDFPGALDCFQKAESYGEKSPYPAFYGGKIHFMKELIIGYLEDSHIIPANLFSTLSEEPDSFYEYALYVILITLIDNNQIERASAIYDTIRLKNEGYRIHINARLAAMRFNLERAKELLLSVIDREDEFSAPFLFDVYEDLERYCKSLEDYETAYRCATMKEKYRYTLQ
jgi:transcriptional regulator with XRE-family HTH domain